MTPVLLVEDDIKIAQEIVCQLEEQKYLVTHLRTLAQTAAVDLQHFSILILDWNLPDGEGIDLVKKIRNKNIEVPVLMLTARTQLEDRQLATDLGVSDFLGKPFFFHELLARVSMLVRAEKSAGNSSKRNEVISKGDLELNIYERKVLFKQREVTLTKKEFDLLLFFMRNPKGVFTRDEILDAVWGRDGTPTNRTVDTHVLQLRKKFTADFFKTVWSTGYRFVVDEK